MKRKKASNRAFRRGLPGTRKQGVTVAILALVIVLALGASYGVMEITERSAHSAAEKLVSQVVEHIDDKMNDVSSVTRLAARRAAEELDDPEALERLTAEFVEENAFVYGSTVAFEPDVFPERGRCFAPYSWVTPDGEVHSRQLGTETDYYEEEWYAETKKSLAEYWCEPYFDEGGAKIMMCTFSVPLTDAEGALVAVMTADVGLEDLEAYLSTISPYPDSCIILRSARGNTLVDAARDPDGGDDTISIKGVTGLGWTVELMLPFTYLVRGDTGVMFYVGIILLIALLLVYAVNYVLNRLQKRASAEYMQVIDAISSSFSSIYLVNLQTKETVTFRDPVRYRQILEGAGADFASKLDRLIEYDCSPQDRARMREETSLDSIRGRLAVQDRYEVRFRKDRSSGNLWYEMHVFVIERDETGSPKRAVIAFTDVNESVLKEKETQETLEHALAMAESASRAKTTFLFNMSHDIRTPMNAILGYTDMAVRHFDEAEVAKDSLRKIRAAGGHLQSLINDILEMSRIEAGKLELSAEPLDLREAVTNTQNMSLSLAIQKSIRFEVVTEELANPYVYADELHFNEVMINVISNAMKYSREDGTVRFTVSQLTAPTDGRARYRFEVADNGIGMSEEFQQHLFEQFSREKSTTISKQEGAGLGLSIVKRIIDLAGGSIGVKSKPDVGTTVTMELPLAVMEPEAIETFRREHETGESLPESYTLTGKRVLLAEDNEMNREIAEEILTEAGLRVESAEDGRAAVEAIKENGFEHYDFILMDIQMPVMNGYEATRELRALPGGDRIPIIAVSANAFEEDRQRSLEAGMNAHIAKPIDVKILFETMRSLSAGTGHS